MKTTSLGSTTTRSRIPMPPCEVVRARGPCQMEGSDDNRWADAQSDQGRGMKLASGASTLEVMEGARRYNRWIYDRVRDGLGQRVLEIGCGTGTITSFMVDRQLRSE